MRSLKQVWIFNQSTKRKLIPKAISIGLIFVSPPLSQGATEKSVDPAVQSEQASCYTAAWVSLISTACSCGSGGCNDGFYSYTVGGFWSCLSAPKGVSGSTSCSSVVTAVGSYTACTSSFNTTVFLKCAGGSVTALAACYACYQSGGSLVSACIACGGAIVAAGGNCFGGYCSWYSCVADTTNTGPVYRAILTAASGSCTGS